MTRFLSHFLHDERGTVTVDWTVLSAAAVSMALATVAVLEIGIDGLTSRIDGELRSQQMSDGFVAYESVAFEPIIELGWMAAEDGEGIFTTVNQLMNAEVLTALEAGIQMMQDGTMTQDDLPVLIALASVADQRNIVSDEMLDHYFGFQDGDPLYLDYF